MISLPRLLLLKSAERLIETALRYDPATRQRLTALEGRRIFIEIHQPEIAFMISVQEGRLLLTSDLHESAHATLEARSLDLLRQALRQQAQWVGGPLRSGGQTQLLETLYQALRQLDIDWEEPLSRWLGDSGAHQIGRQVTSSAACSSAARVSCCRTAVIICSRSSASCPCAGKVRSCCHTWRTAVPISTACKIACNDWNNASP